MGKNESIWHTMITHLFPSITRYYVCYKWQNSVEILQKKIVWSDCMILYEHNYLVFQDALIYLLDMSFKAVSNILKKTEH